MSKKCPSRTRGTIEYFRLQTWSNMNKRCVNGAYHDSSNPKNAIYIRKGIKLTMSRKTFYKWCDENRDRILWYYNNGMTPSVDRIDENKNYHPDNIQVISLKENLEKARLTRR